MANFTTSIQSDFSIASSFFTVAAEDVLEATSSLIRLRAPNGNYQEYRGTFSYTYSDGYKYLSWEGSSLTGFTEYDATWVQQFSVSEGNIPGSTYQWYASNQDSMGLSSFILRENDTITGSSFGDVLWGYADDDAINGGGGNDVLRGDGGNDYLDGGIGNNTAVFSENRSQYTISKPSTDWQVVGPDGTDRLTNIETLQFADQSISLASLDVTPPIAPKLVATSGIRFLTNPQVTLQTHHGDIVLELTPENAPVTTANFLAYVNDAYYDNTLFHRVINNFMVQGGGFTTGLVAKTPTYAPIVLESDNGLSNLRGTIAMARTNVANSATSQFFINQGDNAFLDYQQASSPGYAVFGRVVSGLPTVDSIAQVLTGTVGDYEDAPVTDVTITSIHQTVSGSAASRRASLLVSDLEVGAQWSYSLDSGVTWQTGSGNSFNVPYGSYAENDIQVRQTDVAGNTSTTNGKFTSELWVSSSNFLPSGVVTITGSSTQGQTLNVVTSTLNDVDGLGTLKYQWLADGNVISGAISATLKLTEAQVGKPISVSVSYLDGYGTSEVVTSAATAAVLNVNDSPYGVLKITGLPIPGQTLTVNNKILDADGTGPLNHQWQVSSDGGHQWNNIAEAAGSTYTVGSDMSGKQLRVVGYYTDGHNSQEAVASRVAAIQETLADKTLDIVAYTWKSQALLDGIHLRSTGLSEQSTVQGSARFSGIAETDLTLEAARTIPISETMATSQSVNLLDAISILKMIVGLDVNGTGKALSPYQAYAADFDENGAVQLTDAIGVLKHVVGLSAPTPRWIFFNEADALTGKDTMNPGLLTGDIQFDLSEAASTIQVGLVGVLRGDVDGSDSSMSSASHLDAIHIQNLLAENGFDAARFGIYS